MHSTFALVAYIGHGYINAKRQVTVFHSCKLVEFCATSSIILHIQIFLHVCCFVYCKHEYSFLKGVTVYYYKRCAGVARIHARSFPFPKCIANIVICEVWNMLMSYSHFDPVGYCSIPEYSSPFPPIPIPAKSHTNQNSSNQTMWMLTVACYVLLAVSQC